MNFIVKTLAVAVLLSSQVAHAGVVDVEHYPVREDMQLPFSEAVRVGHMLYLSGQLGYDAETSKLVEGGIAAETRKTMENIKATLEKHGSSMAEVVKCTVFLADIKEWAAMNEVYVPLATLMLPIPHYKYFFKSKSKKINVLESPPPPPDHRLFQDLCEFCPPPPPSKHPSLRPCTD